MAALMVVLQGAQMEVLPVQTVARMVARQGMVRVEGMEVLPVQTLARMVVRQGRVREEEMAAHQVVRSVVQQVRVQVVGVVVLLVDRMAGLHWVDPEEGYLA